MKHQKQTLIALVVALLSIFALASTHLNAATLIVLNSTDDLPGSLRQTVAMAASGDTIIFSPVTTLTPITLTSGEILLDKDLRIEGNGTVLTQITAGGSSRIFHITSGNSITLEGMSLMDGTAGQGGAIWIGNSDLMVANAAISNCSASTDGGAIYSDGGDVTISDTDITQCMASGPAGSNGGGAVFNAGGSLVINTGSMLTGNMAKGASGSGGAIFSSWGSVTATNVSFADNSANRAGGAIEIVDGLLNLIQVDFFNNDVNGGAGTPNPGNGGALHVTGVANIFIDGGSARQNKAAREGGAYWNQAGSTMTIQNWALIKNNRAYGDGADDGGGGIFNNGGDLIIDGTLGTITIQDNTAEGISGSGGGIFSTDGNVSIYRSLIRDNSANRAGGGIEIVDGTLDITDCYLLSNDVDGGAGTPNPGNGGALHVTGNATLVTITGGADGVRIARNKAASEGGGLWNQAGSTMKVLDWVLIKENIAKGDAGDNGGGGVFNNGGTLVIDGLSNLVTLTGNLAVGTSGSGGALLSTDGAVTINATTMDHNSANRAGGAIEIIDGSLDITATDFIQNDVAGGAGSPNPGNGGAIHITGVTMTNIEGGKAYANEAGREGGAFWNQVGSTMMISKGTRISSNLAYGDAADDGGAGIFNNGGDVIVDGTDEIVRIEQNIASGSSASGGGVLSLSGTLDFTNTFFRANAANRAGGGLEVIDGMVDLNNCYFIGNDVAGAAGTPNPGNGGAIHISGVTTMHIKGGRYNKNKAGREGGALWNQAGSTMNITDGTMIAKNKAFGDAADDGGAGIFNNGGDMMIDGSAGEIVISNNVASGTSASGGGLLSTNGMISIRDASFKNNAANRAGGAIELVDGVLNIAQTLMTRNDVAGAAGAANPGNGGAVHITGIATITIDTCVVTQNLAGREGGGLWNQAGSTMTVNATALNWNEAHGSTTVDGGGGIFNNGGILHVVRSTVSNNSATGSTGLGGGILNAAGGMLNLDYSTVSRNDAVSYGGGFANSTGTVSLLASTIAENISGQDGGGFAQLMSGDAVTSEGTLIADNTALGNADFYVMAGTASSGGFNLVSMDDGDFPGTASDLVGSMATPIDAMLQPLAENGGPTKTHALVCGSPAIGAGNAADVAADQRGMAPFDGRDIGSFELQSACLTTLAMARSQLNVFPNPIQGNQALTVAIPAGVDENSLLRLTSVATGQVVLQQAVQPDRSQIKLQLGDLPGGTYLIECSVGRSVTFIEKLVIVK